MTNRYGTSVDIQSLLGNTELLLAVEHLNSEGFIQFPEPDIFRLEAKAL